MTRYILTIFFCASFFSAATQNELDTISATFMAAEVHVVSKSEDALPTTDHFALEDDLSMQSSDLGLLLDRKGLYGVLATGAPGSASSLKFHGLGSDHSVFYWNDVPINSISLGTCDLSLIPSFLFDNVNVYTATDNLRVANNNLGAAVCLSNDHVQLGSNYMRCLSSYNSLGNSFLGIDLSASRTLGKSAMALASSAAKKIFTSRTKIFLQDLQNQFSYRDQYTIERPVVEQVHNNGSNRGVQQDMELKWQKNAIGFHVWMQQKSMLLPSQMGDADAGGAQQEDSFLRSILFFQRTTEKMKVKFSSSFNSELQNYRAMPTGDGIWTILSTVRSRSIFNQMNITRRLASCWNTRLNVVYVIPQVINTNYENGGVMYPWFQANGGLTFLKKGFKVEADSRFDTRAQKLIPWTMYFEKAFSLGSNELVSGVQLSRKIRVPDMNELYWNPGGNPLLKPESGRSGNAFVGFNSNSKSSVSCGITSRVSSSVIENWIQWLPGLSGYWSPVNYKLVRTKCLENSFFVRKKFRAFALEWNARHQLNDTRVSNETQEGSKKMIYTPYQTAFAEMLVAMRRFDFRISGKYTGTRFTDEQNLIYRELQPYVLTSAEILFHQPFRLVQFSAGIRCDNIFNVQYESVRAYAMPGRVLQFNLQIQLNKKQTQTP